MKILFFFLKIDFKSSIKGVHAYFPLSSRNYYEKNQVSKRPGKLARSVKQAQILIEYSSSYVRVRFLLILFGNSNLYVLFGGLTCLA